MAEMDTKALARDYVAQVLESGKEEIINELKAAMPDLAVDLDDLVAEGDEVVVLWHSTGRQTGELWGIDPTDRVVNTRHFTRLKFGPDGIVGAHTITDRMSILAQLGSVGRYAPDFGLAARQPVAGA